MPQYRKRYGGGTYDRWHWCRNCTQDPKQNHHSPLGAYQTRETRPESETLCSECAQLERSGRCIKLHKPSS